MMWMESDMADEHKNTNRKLAKLYLQNPGFTMMDVLKYLETTPTVPAWQVIAELEALHRKLRDKNGNE